LPLVERWIFSRAARTAAQMNDALAEYRFHEAAHVVYHFVWGDFCDWYIEWQKPLLTSSDREAATAAWRNIFSVFEAALRLLHPFMPFLTEELWHRLPQASTAKSIALAEYPAPKPEWIDEEAERQFALLQETITAAREIRATLKIDPKRKVAADFSAGDTHVGRLVEEHSGSILRLALLSEIRLVPRKQLDSKNGLIRSTSQFDMRIGYSEGVDVAGELTKLRKEKERMEKDLELKRSRLSDETFRSRAPAEIVRGLENTLSERSIEYQKLLERLAQLEKTTSRSDSGSSANV